MTMIDSRITVGELVTERPSRSRVFERLRIDYCCGGKTPLDQACAEKGLSAEQVLRELEAAEAGNPVGEETDWSQAPMSQLVDHIVATHHVYLRRELPRLTGLVDKVAEVHGERHRELSVLRSVYRALVNELESHMLKEEQVLFPMIRELESATVLPGFHCGSVNNPIRVMEHEHDDAGAALARMRTLTDGYTVPADGCNTYRAMVDALADLERDLHTHIHKENNILFPKAAAAEARLAATA
jgi:regulator of cell morphogenesis and NO signaling